MGNLGADAKAIQPWRGATKRFLIDNICFNQAHACLSSNLNPFSDYIQYQQSLVEQEPQIVLKGLKMLQRAMLRSRARPFAAKTCRISNPNPTHPTELSSVQVSRASKNRSLSRIPGTIQFISTARRKADPRRGSSRFDRGLEHSLDVLQHEMTCTECHDSVWGLAVGPVFISGS